MSDWSAAANAALIVLLVGFVFYRLWKQWKGK